MIACKIYFPIYQLKYVMYAGQLPFSVRYC